MIEPPENIYVGFQTPNSTGNQPWATAQERLTYLLSETINISGEMFALYLRIKLYYRIFVNTN